ncbi:MAG: ribonuclease III [Chromatiales bacterium]
MRLLEYRFDEPALLEQALTHRSARRRHNERLEFLGDALLGVVIAGELYRRFPAADEGQLTRLRATLVREESLVELAQRLEIGASLQLGEGELKSGGFRRASILANALEAIIGAIYLDGGFEACRRRVVALFDESLRRLSLEELKKDPKTDLQEWLQARHLALPAYRTVKVEGEPHNRHFTVECELAGVMAPVRGEGRSRRLAEQNAATAALALLRDAALKA